MLYRLFTALCLLILAPALPAADLASITAIEGVYAGEVMNGGDMDPHTMTFSFDRNDRFSGQYVIDDESGVFEGTLSNLIPEGGTAFSFEWTDQHGEGFIYIDFTRDYSSFSGYWTSNDTQQQFPINGRRR